MRRSLQAAARCSCSCCRRRRCMRGRCPQVARHLVAAAAGLDQEAEALAAKASRQKETVEKLAQDATEAIGKLSKVNMLKVATRICGNGKNKNVLERASAATLADMIISGVRTGGGIA